MFKKDDTVRYAEGWYREGEENYLFVVLETNYGHADRVKIGCLNTNLSLGSVEVVDPCMIVKVEEVQEEPETANEEKGENTMYNYLEEMKEDIRNYIEENYTEENEFTSTVDLSEFADLDEFVDALNDALWTEDSVTGNASGSYTFSRAKAAEYVLDNLDLLEECCKELGITDAEIGSRFLAEDFEWMDVTIRCYTLFQAIIDVAEEYAEHFEG